MKRVILILMIITGLTLYYSCEKEDKIVLDMEKAISPVLTSPSGGQSYVLLQENLEETVTTFEWSAAEYPLEDLPEIRYAVEVDLTENNFTSPATIGVTSETSLPVTVNRLNNSLLPLGVEPEEEYNTSVRVRSFISNASEDIYLYSQTVEIAVTPFEFEVKPIYLLGDATTAGWDNNAAIEMEHINDGEFAIVEEIIDGPWIKFLSVLGQWAPQWGTDDSGTSEEGPLVYRPTEDVDDPPAIPAPEPGEYRIVADTANLLYTITPVDEKLYLIGDMDGSSWNSSTGIEMTKTAPGKFKHTFNHSGEKGSNIQITNSVSNATKKWGSHSRVAHLRGKMIETKHNNNVKIYLPDIAGEYIIEVNLATMKYTIRAK